MIYVITGHLGSGKTLLSVKLAMDYLTQGRRVASNMTLNLENGLPDDSRATAIKLPYIPTSEHLNTLGEGYEGPYDEDKFGLVLLDEAGTWLNSRDWNDKDRRGLFQWITHARKYGWDVALIVQDYEALDAQIRRSVTEVFVKCSRLDRVKLPWLPMRMPKIHRAKALYTGPNGPLYKTWHTSGTKIHDCYNTREAVRPEYIVTPDGLQEIRPMYSMLSPWHLKGRYLPPKRSWQDKLRDQLQRLAKAMQAGLPKKPKPPPTRLVSHSLRAYRLGLRYC